MPPAKRQSTPEDDQKRFGVSMSADDEKALAGRDDGAQGGNGGDSTAANTGAGAETTSTTTTTGAGAETGRTAETGKPAAQSGTEPSGTAKPDGQGDAKTVPLAALHEEREKRKELQKQIETLTQARGEDSKTVERLRQIVEKLNLNPAPAQPEPKPAAGTPAAKTIEETIDTDPVQAVRMSAAEIKVLSDFKKQIEAGNAAALETQNVLGKTLELEQEFIKTAADYNNASAYLKNSRAAELRAYGYSQLQINQAIGQESIDLAKGALARGENPAKVIYEMAKSRGYQRPAFLPNEAQALQKYGADQETTFKSTTPDYDAAMDFLVKSRTDEYKAAGFTEDQAKQFTERDRVSILVNAHRANANPAERAYAIAKARGYVPKAANGDGSAADRNGSAPAPASNEDGAAQIARMKRGQEAAMSLGGANGSARGKTGIDALLAMSDADFSSALGKMSKQQERAYFGD